MGRSGLAALEAFLNAYRTFAHRRPRRWTLMEYPNAADPGVVVAATRMVEIAYAVVRGFGLDEREQVDAVRTVRAAVNGFLALEIGGGYQLERDPDASFQFLVKVLAKGLVAS